MNSRLKIRKKQSVIAESIRCIYCKEILSELSSEYELENQVHLSCRTAIDAYRKDKRTLPDEKFKRLQRFLKEFDVTQYRYLRNEELFRVQKLNLNTKNITYLPGAIESLRNVKALGLMGNKLIALPDELGSMKQLELLNLSVNNFNELPSILEKLPFITSFMYAGNNLDHIPEILMEFKHLKVLTLSYNNIKEIPEELAEIKTLEKLYLKRNAILFLPDSLRNLKKLRVLDLEYNCLEEIPSWIEEHQYDLLNLKNNPIENLEVKLHKLQALLMNGVVV